MLRTKTFRKIQEAIDCLQGHFVPRKDTQLYKWIADSHAYTSGCAVQTPNNFEQGTYNTNQTSMTLESAWILRHIMYTHHLPVRKVLMLWAEFHVLILRTPVNPEWFVSERTLWYHVHRLHHIDNALLTSSFADSICERTENGFLRYFYSSSDDSKHFNRNRHVCLISQLINDHPGFRHITSSVNEVKSDNAGKNSEAIIDVLGLRNAAHYGGGCNDNAADAQNEIGVTFRKIMDEVRALDEGNDIRQLLYENGVEVERRPIKYGDPYHISNLAVSHASEAAFGGTEHGDHSQVHHCQLLQSIHDLHSSDKPFAQQMMNDVLSGSVELKVKTKKERKQRWRWLVNQQNATQTLEMYYTTTPEGNSALIEWALKFANESTSDWKRRVGQEIATWLSMPSILLGLHFESELGNYFEEIYAWHCRSGGLNKRSGFRMMEIYDVWLGFEVPWWNKAIENPEKQLPKTMKYLDDNFEGEEHAFRKSQIMRGRSDESWSWV